MANKAAVLKVRIVRKSDELGIIWGWASEAEVEDLDGDEIPQADLEKGMYLFMENYYANAAMVDENHNYKPAEAVIVESALQWLAGSLRWWIGIKLLSADLREAARDGKISGFSIAGVADVVEG